MVRAPSSPHSPDSLVRARIPPQLQSLRHTPRVRPLDSPSHHLLSRCVAFGSHDRTVIASSAHRSRAACAGSATGFFGVALLEPTTPTLEGRCKPAALDVRLGNHVGHFNRPSVSIDRDERDVARVRVPPYARYHVLRLDPHTDFH